MFDFFPPPTFPFIFLLLSDSTKSTIPLEIYISRESVGGPKSSYDDITAVDDFFNQWDWSIATMIKEVRALQEELC